MPLIPQGDSLLPVKTQMRMILIRTLRMILIYRRPLRRRLSAKTQYKNYVSVTDALCAKQQVPKLSKKLRAPLYHSV